MNKTSDEINIPTIVLVTFLSLLIFLILVVGAQTWYYHIKNEQEFTKIISSPSIALDSHHANQLELLNSYRWIDKEQQIVGIPIDRAMQLIAQERNAGSGLTK